MRMVDIIEKKRDRIPLSKEEIEFVVENYTLNKIPDYQMSSLLMAIVLNGMDKQETFYLTDSMLHSGDILDLSAIKGVKVDKHSTGGVGDKVTLIVGPLVASCNAKLAKMSGRGLGHTGGTLDKLESIPGFNIYLTEDEFIKQVNEIGIAVIGQTANLDPADKKMYALRDVTGTVNSIPLIASSIMSKKLASGADTILLDVKFGNGAFMKDYKSARELAKTMVEIGKYFNKDTRAEISSMENPLGRAVGNILEIKEACLTLQGQNTSSDLIDLCLSSSATMLVQAKLVPSYKEGKKLVEEKLKNGEAFEVFKKFIAYQKGDVSYIEDLSKFPVSKNIIPIYALEDGYVKHISALDIGISAMKLGAGRETLNDKIDYNAGIYLNKKPGEKVNKGDVIATLYTNKDEVENIKNDVLNAYSFSVEKVRKSNIIKGKVE